MFPSRLVSVLGGGVGLENNYSLDFDGTNDYVDVGTAYNGVKSISFLLKVDDVTSNTDYILGLNDTDYISVVDGTVTLSGFSGGTNTIYVDASEASTVDTAWHHILITSTTARNASNCDLGRTQSNNSYNMVGNLDEVAFTSDVKSASDFADGTTPLDISGLSNLQNWWRMGDGTLDDFALIADQVNPTLGSELWDDDYSSGTGDWTPDDENGLENDSGAIKITYVDNEGGAYIYLKDADDLNSDLTAGKTYKMTLETKVNTGSVDIRLYNFSAYTTYHSITSTSFVSKNIYFVAESTTGVLMNVLIGSGEEIWLKNFSLKEVGGNPGIMTNMASDDIVKDTP